MQKGSGPASGRHRGSRLPGAAMTFLTNNLDWSARTICDLYRCRWQIEVFFKQPKQTLQVADFLGNSTNAAKWQLWTTPLLMLLLRFMAHLSKWATASCDSSRSHARPCGGAWIFWSCSNAMGQPKDVF